MKQKRQNQHSPERATLTKILREGYDTPPLNEHNKAEYPPMHNGEFNTSPIAIYTSEDNTISLDVKLENETVWLSQAQMSMLFDADRTSILRHINNVYKIGDLERESTYAKFAQVK